jgi:ABC-2 type transport system ATP-binding protein
VIELRHIHKRFGKREVLTDVGFSVGRGEVVGFVGPNGAGKTTTLRIITGFLDADRGTVEIDGVAVDEDRARAAGRIGYLPEATPLYGDMRVEELLRFRARLKGVARRGVDARVDAVVGECGLGEERRRLIGQLSKGFRQRVGLADALLAEPPILILDEPTSGLDPVQVRELRTLLARLARDRTVLLSSHILPEVERVAARVIVMVGGRVVADGAPGSLRDGLALPADASFEDVFVALAAAEDGDPA